MVTLGVVGVDSGGAAAVGAVWPTRLLWLWLPLP